MCPQKRGPDWDSRGQTLVSVGEAPLKGSWGGTQQEWGVRDRHLTHHETVELLRLRAKVSRAVTHAELSGPGRRAGHQ